MARKAAKTTQSSATATAEQKSTEVANHVSGKRRSRVDAIKVVEKVEEVEEAVLTTEEVKDLNDTNGQAATRTTPRRAVRKKLVIAAKVEDDDGQEAAESEVVDNLQDDAQIQKSPRSKIKSASRRRAEEEVTKASTEDAQDTDIQKKKCKTPALAKKRKAAAASDIDGNADAELPAGEESGKAKKRRKTKDQKEAEAMPLAPRTVVAELKRSMFIGAHVSAAGGVHKSIENAMHIGANSFALFLKSQRKWASPPMANEARDGFRAAAASERYDVAAHTLPHGSYLVNLAQVDADKAKQAYDCFLDDLQRCEELGIKLYNFHPGNTGGAPRHEALSRIAAQLNRAHKATNSVVTVLENMAGSGNIVGSTFEDLRDIIAQIDDKTRVGVCIDTCHSFAAGYDLRTPESFAATMTKFDQIVGMPYLKALHLNDSKAPFESHRDLHANIGTGFLGLRAFHNIMNFAGFQNLPMVLETPIDRKGEDGKTLEDKSVWAREIKLLEGLIGRDAESDEFKEEETRLWNQGEGEREKIQKQVDKRVQKTLDDMLKAASPKKGKGKKRVKDEEAEEDSAGCSH